MKLQTGAFGRLNEKDREKASDIVAKGPIYYLVVHHYMNSPVCRIGRQVTQVERLINYTLTSKSSITMQKNGHHLEGERTTLSQNA